MSRGVVGVICGVVLIVVLVVLALLALWMWHFGATHAHRVHVQTTTSAASHAPLHTTAIHAPTRTAVPRLTSLNGSVHCLDGESITRELWARMRDLNASDPRIKPYLEWLRAALSPQPHKALNVPWYPRYTYWWFNDGYYYAVDWRDAYLSLLRDKYVPMRSMEKGTALCYILDLIGNTIKCERAFVPPPTTGVVRIGLLELPFGAGLVVTAWQVNGSVFVVVHGTIVNAAQWRELLARVATFVGGPLDYDNVSRVRVQWVLWRIALPGYGSYLEVNGTRLPIREVMVLLEMPAYGFNVTDETGTWYRYWHEAESAYWDVVGHPALALAIHLTEPERASPAELYAWLPIRITSFVVLTGVRHPGNILEGKYYTPFLIRSSGRGVCNEQSWSTLMFAVNALGACAALVDIPPDWLPPYGHDLSALFGAGGPLDIDRNGRPESRVIVDTADLDPSFINEVLRECPRCAYLHPPLIYIDDYDHREYCGLHPAALLDEAFHAPIIYPDILLAGPSYEPWFGYFWSGVVDAVLGLPSWLRAPWLGYAMRVCHFDRFHDEAWSRQAIVGYVLELRHLGEVRRELPKLMPGPLYVQPPSVALALRKVLHNLPLVLERPTPKLPKVKVLQVVVKLGRIERFVVNGLPRLVSRGSAVVDGHNVTVVVKEVCQRYLQGMLCKRFTELYIDGQLMVNASKGEFYHSMYAALGYLPPPKLVQTPSGTLVLVPPRWIVLLITVLPPTS